MKPVLNQAVTLGIVTAVTILVWLYAEDANVQEYTAQPVRVEFILPEDSEGRITPDGPITVQIDFNGSNGQYQQFIADTRGKQIPIDLPFDPESNLETLDVDLSELLDRYVFGDLGINVTRVTPERASVTLEKDVAVTLEVRVVQDTGAVKLSSAQIAREEDRSITLSVPASRLSELDGVNAVVRVSEPDIEGIARGVEGQVTLPVELPARLRDLRPNAKTVDVLVTVADDRDTVTIDRRPVLLSYPASINERYTIALDAADRIINAFTLDGPRGTIEQLKADLNSPLVWATVRLTNEEVDAAAADGGELVKTVEIMAPPGVVLTSDVVPVTIRVTPRTAPVEP